MKAYRMEELQALTDAELRQREKTLREALFRMRMKIAIGQFSKVADVSATRRNLARVLTVLRVRELGKKDSVSETAKGQGL
jgi:large subunit ribosomal protein L29